jgi:hypothetical protein
MAGIFYFASISAHRTTGGKRTKERSSWPLFFLTVCIVAIAQENPGYTALFEEEDFQPQSMKEPNKEAAAIVCYLAKFHDFTVALIRNGKIGSEDLCKNFNLHIEPLLLG